MLKGDISARKIIQNIQAIIDLKLPDIDIKSPPSEPTDISNIRQFDENRTLLLADINFLNMYGNMSDTIVYIGIPSESYIKYMSKLYINKEFIVVDPNIQSTYNDGNIQIISQPMNSSIYDMVRNRNAIMIAHQSHVVSDERITENNRTYVEWIENMNPICSLIRFSGISSKQIQYSLMYRGQQYVQIGSDPSSNDTWLVIMKPYSLMKYDNKSYLNNIKQHQYVTRTQSFGQNLNIPHNFDELAEMLVLGNYIINNNQQSISVIDDIHKMSLEITDILSNKPTYDISKLSPPFQSRLKNIENLFGNVPLVQSPPTISTLGDVPNLPYVYTSTKWIDRSHHVGQFKLFMSEVNFLTSYVQNPIDDKFIVIYAGSAPGHHDAYLSYLFPNMKMVMIDPNYHEIRNEQNLAQNVDVIRDSLYFKFSTQRILQKPERIPAFGTHYVDKKGNISDISDSGESVIEQMNKAFIKQNSPPIGENAQSKVDCSKQLIKQLTDDIDNKSTRKFYIIEDFFTTEYAESLKQLHDATHLPILYISDIRLNLTDLLDPIENQQLRGVKFIAKHDPYSPYQEIRPSDLDIIINNAQQHMWIDTLRPDLSMLKFRCPFHNEQDEIDVTLFKNHKFAEFSNELPEQSLNKSKEPNIPTSIKFYYDVAKEYKTRFGIDIVDDYLNNLNNSGNDKYKWVYTIRLDLQMFQGSSSTETRAIVDKKTLEKGPDSIFDYSYKLHESLCYGYNIIRNYLFYPQNQRYFTASIGLDGCSDCNNVISVFKTYFTKIGIIDQNQLQDKVLQTIKDSLTTINRNLLPKHKDGSIHGKFTQPLSLNQIISIELNNYSHGKELLEQFKALDDRRAFTYTQPTPHGLHISRTLPQKSYMRRNVEREQPVHRGHYIRKNILSQPTTNPYVPPTQRKLSITRPDNK